MNKLLWKKIVEQALLEDLGQAGDLTSFILGENNMAIAHIVAKEDAVLAGMELVHLVYNDFFNCEVTFKKFDGQEVSKGDRIALIRGRADRILTGERVALNFLQFASSIATNARKFASQVKTFSVIDTRKTIPLLRSISKYAVMIGANATHRYTLTDFYMIKDNHRKFGNLKDLILKLRQKVGPMPVIEVEIESMEELKQVVDLPINIVMLDNMSNEEIEEALRFLTDKNSSFLVEVSGGIDFERLKQLDEMNEKLIGEGIKKIDVVSTGKLTYDIRWPDFSLEILEVV